MSETEEVEMVEIDGKWVVRLEPKVFELSNNPIENLLRASKMAREKEKNHGSRLSRNNHSK